MHRRWWLAFLAAFIGISIVGCGGVHRPGEDVAPGPAPVVALLVDGDYSAIATCVKAGIGDGEKDKPRLVDLAAEGRAIITLNLTAGAFDNFVQLFEASFTRTGEARTAIGVRERGSLVGGSDHWLKTITGLAETCSAQMMRQPKPTKRKK